MTATAIAPGKRAAKWSATTRRHSWDKPAEHHYECTHCGLAYENKLGRGGYHKFWTWPPERGMQDGNTLDGSKVPSCPGPYVPPAPRKPELVCSKCDAELLAVAPLVIHGGGRGGMVQLDARDVEGGFVVVKIGDEWAVRVAHRDDEPEHRRREHKCGPYRYRCLGKAGKCTARGRLYAIGTFCDECSPANR